MTTKPDSDKTPGFLSVVQSTLAAAFGVQSERKRQQDFSTGRPGQFIAAGLIFTVLFVVLLVGIAHLVI